MHRDIEHNGARDLEDIAAMREADAIVATWPPLAPTFGIWAHRPENARAVAANERAGFTGWPLQRGVPPRPHPTPAPGPGMPGSR